MGSVAERDRPWLIRTYSGHSSARASNELYRANLAKGQTGLSVAFDLPTQTGYDPDDVQARGEVGKVGVPVPHLGEMRTLFAEIPLDTMNTSMTINATAMWLLGMYLALADEHEIAYEKLSGTTQNDILKEYLSRGTYIFPPEASKRLTVDLIAYTVKHVPAWNPINVCPYHLQEAGATPVQELAYGLANAIAVLDAVRESGQVPPDDFPEVVGRISFFIDAGVRFVEEMCKMRAFTEMWDRICAERYGVTDPKLRRFRYGMQVNSLGLTEEQPENNVQRIVLEMLGVTLSKNARARAVQLPCWNEALGLPTPWDQQWSLRIQQVLAYESDLLEYGDLFDGSKVVEAKVAALVEEAERRAAAHPRRRRVVRHDRRDEGPARAEPRRTGSPHRIGRARGRRCERVHRDRAVAARGQRADAAASSPSTRRSSTSTFDAHRAVARRARQRRGRGRARHGSARSRRPPRTSCPRRSSFARAAGTVGEWARALREVFGEYRAPTGVGGGRRPGGLRDAGGARGDPGGRRRVRWTADPPARRQARPRRPLERRRADRGRGPRRRDGGRLPGNPAHARGDRGRRPRRGRRRRRTLDPVGLAPRAGTGNACRSCGRPAWARPVVVGGIIPDADRVELEAMGVARVYTPKDFRLARIMADIAELARDHRLSTPQAGANSRR